MSRRQTEEWIRRARTPETRASIRRWARRSELYFWAGLLLVVGGIAFVVWSVVTERHNTRGFWGLIAVTVVLILMCVGFGIHAGGRLSEARFADGHVSVGRVDEVVMHAGAEGPDTYDIWVSAVASGAVIHRRICGLVSETDVGEAVRFRHNTLDPEDLDDVLFDGWQGQWSTPSRHQLRALYADAHVSTGRVEEVISYPGFPGDDDRTTYRLMIRIDLPGSVTLRREVDLGEERLRSTGRRFGRAIRVRHRTFDPEDLSDAFFDGWADEAGR